MLFRPNPTSGVPIYLQLIEQVKHAVGTGALRPGDQLPGIRRVAEDLVINPNTVAKAYRELEHDGVIELRQGAGAYVAESAGVELRARSLAGAQPVARGLVGKLAAMGLSEEEVRRLVEAELAALRERKAVSSKKR